MKRLIYSEACTLVHSGIHSPCTVCSCTKNITKSEYDEACQAVPCFLKLYDLSEVTQEMTHQSFRSLWLNQAMDRASQPLVACITTCLITASVAPYLHCLFSNYTYQNCVCWQKISCGIVQCNHSNWLCSQWAFLDQCNNVSTDKHSLLDHICLCSDELFTIGLC